MSGYFSSVDEPYSSNNNVARDYDRLKGHSPGGFDRGGLGRLFDRLFAGQPKDAGSIQSTPLPDLTPTSTTTPTVASPAPKPGAPAISSGGSLLQRILGASSSPPTHNQAGEPLVPGTGMTTQQFMQAMVQAFGQTAQNAPMGMPGGSPQGGPGNPGDSSMNPGMPFSPMQMGQVPPRAPAPPQPTGPSPFGNQTFGGNTFGGNTFGGNRFGGQQFGASAPRGAGPMPAAEPQMSGGHSPMPWMERLRAANGWFRPTEQGFFRGGELAMRRGGYPEHLMHGIPTRYAAGSYVEPDGQGDGRSDHVPAKLSPGEFVMDAETVSLLGNGDNEAGARELERLRQNLRRQKGRALAKGKFSPDAHAPEHYMRRG